MAILINGKVIPNKNVKKVDEKGEKTLKKRKEIDRLIVGKKIYFLGKKEEDYPLFEGRIIDILPENLFKVKVIDRNIKNKDGYKTVIISRKYLHISK